MSPFLRAAGIQLTTTRQINDARLLDKSQICDNIFMYGFKMFWITIWLLKSFQTTEIRDLHLMHCWGNKRDIMQNIICM